MLYRWPVEAGHQRSWICFPVIFYLFSVERISVGTAAGERAARSAVCLRVRRGRKAKSPRSTVEDYRARGFPSGDDSAKYGNPTVVEMSPQEGRHMKHIGGPRQL